MIQNESGQIVEEDTTDFWQQQQALEQAELQRQAELQQAELQRQAQEREQANQIALAQQQAQQQAEQLAAQQQAQQLAEQQAQQLTQQTETPTGIATLVPNTQSVDTTGNTNNQLSGVILSGASWMAGDEKTKLAEEAFGQDVTNTAIGGQKTSDVLNQLNVFERDGGTFAPGSTVVLDIGANDIAQGVDEATIRNNLNEIVSRLGDKGVKVILSGQPEAHSYDEAIKSTNLQMDDLYSDIAKNHSNVTLVDAMSGFLNQKDLMDESGFHLKDDASKLQYLNQFADAYKNLNTADKNAVDGKLATADTTDTAAVAKAINDVTGSNLTTADTTQPTVDKAAVTTKLADQILGQKLTDKWSGEGFGSAEANASDMAKILSDIGITDIKDFGKITKTIPASSYETEQGTVEVPEQTITTYGNKVTGQEVPNTYSERQSGNFFGGTFAGKGNTGYGVQFDAQGNPYFYTQGASSNDLANLMQDLGPIGQIGLAVATGGLSIPEQIAANMAVQVLSGKDIGDAIKGAAISYAGSQIPGLDAVKEGTSFLKDLNLPAGVTDSLTKSFQNAVVSGGTALLSGKDVGDAMLKGAVTGGTNGAVNALMGNVEGFSDLTDNQKKMVTNAVTGVISGKPLNQIAINTAIAAANNEVAKAKGVDTISSLQKAGLTEKERSLSDLLDEQTTIDASGARDVNAAATFADEQGYNKFKFDGKTYNLDTKNAENTIALLEANALKETTDKNLAGGEFAGLDKAIADADKRNTVTLKADQADTVEEAVALARTINPTATKIVIGDQVINVAASNDQMRNAVLESKLSEAKTASDAKKIALAEYGPNTAFKWTDPSGKEQTLVTLTTPTSVGSTLPYKTNTAIADAVSNKLSQNLNSMELNPADLTKAEMAKYVNTYSTATDAQRSQLLKGSDSSTFKVIDTLFKDTARLNPTGAISELDKPFSANQTAAENARLARLASASTDATGAVGVLGKNIYTPTTADVTTRLTDLASNTVTPTVSADDTTGLKVWDKGSIATAVDVAKSAGNIAAADIAGLGVRGAQFLGDLMGQDTDGFAKVQNLLVNDKNKSMSKLVGDEKTVAAGIASGVESAVSFILGGPLAAVSTIAGVVANNTWVQGANAWISSKGDVFNSKEEARAAGVSDVRQLTPTENGMRTATMTAIEVAGEMLGIPGMKAYMKGIPITGSVSQLVDGIKRQASAQLSENATEALTTIGQFSADKFASFGLNQNASFEDFQKALVDTVKATTAAVGTSTGIATAYNSATGVNTSKISDENRTAVSPDSLLTSGAKFGAKPGDTSNQGLNQVSSEAIDFSKLDKAKQTTILDNLRSNIANVGLSAALTFGSVGSIANAADVGTYVTNTIESAAKSGSNVSNAINTSVSESINSAVTNKVSSETAINSAVSSAVSSAVANNVSSSTAINSAVTSAVNTASTNAASTTAAVTTAVNSAVSTAISASVANNTLTPSTFNATVNAAVNSAVQAAVANNVSTTNAVNTAVTAAVTAAVANNVSTTAAVQAAVAAVTNLNVNVAAVTALATNVANSVATPTPVTTTTTTLNVPTSTPVSTDVVTPTTTVTPPDVGKPPVVTPPVVTPPAFRPPVKPTATPTPKVTVPSPSTGYTMPQAQNIAAAFGMPQLANVFYYGKDFSSKRQKLNKEGDVVEEEYRPLSVTMAGAEGEMMADIAEEQKNKENNVNDALDLILGKSSESMSLDDILNIVKGA